MSYAHRKIEEVKGLTATPKVVDHSANAFGFIRASNIRDCCRQRHPHGGLWLFEGVCFFRVEPLTNGFEQLCLDTANVAYNRLIMSRFFNEGLLTISRHAPDWKIRGGTKNCSQECCIILRYAVQSSRQ